MNILITEREREVFILNIFFTSAPCLPSSLLPSSFVCLFSCTRRKYFFVKSARKVSLVCVCVPCERACECARVCACAFI